MSISVEDVEFLLNTVADASGHETGGGPVLKNSQAAIKAYIADKPDLQDQKIVSSLDRALKLSVLATIPFATNLSRYLMVDQKDYVDPPEEKPTVEPAQPDSSTVESQTPNLEDAGSSPAPVEPETKDATDAYGEVL